MPTLTTSLNVIRNGSSLKSTSVDTTFDNTVLEFDDHTELATATNHDLPLSVTYTDIAYLYFYCDIAVTIKTNSTGSPDQTISLAAGKPLKWATGDADACPITANLTHLYLTTASNAGACLFIIGTNT